VVHPREGGAGEGHRAEQSGDAQAVLDVAEGVLLAERREVAADADTLFELAQLAAPELVLELGLADQDDLEELARGRLEGGEDADLLEGLDAHLLRLVEYHHHRLALLPRGEEMLVQRGHELALGGTPPVDAEVVEDGADQLDVREVGVEDERALDVGGQLAQERAAEGGLAGAHVADEGHEPLLAGDAVEETGQDLVVAFRPEEEAWVGRENEGRILEAEECLVHRPTSRPSCRRRRPSV
jgi:hypothetical protein